MLDYTINDEAMDFAIFICRLSSQETNLLAPQDLATDRHHHSDSGSGKRCGASKLF